MMQIKKDSEAGSATLNISSIIHDIKASMNRAIKASGKSREQVMDIINAMAADQGVPITSQGRISFDTFQKWLNPREESRVPSLKGLALFNMALGTSLPLGVFAGFFGGQVIDGDDIKLLEWAKAHREAKTLIEQMREIENSLRKACE